MFNIFKKKPADWNDLDAAQKKLVTSKISKAIKAMY